MKNKLMAAIGLILVMLVPARFVLAAEDSKVAALENEVTQLREQMMIMKQQMSDMQAHIAAPQGKEFTGKIIPPLQEPSGGLVHTLQDIHMGGFADVEFNQNLGAQTTNAGGNPLRSSDADQNTFSVTSLALNFEKLANEKGGAGFRVDINAGRAARSLNAFTTGSTAGDFAFQKAYVQLVAPLSFLEGNELFGDTVDLKIGRFATLAGVEVFEPHLNWNISRSFLFGLAEPATHTGLRAKYQLFQDKVTTFWGVNNGWDSVVDNNQFKTLESGVSFSPLKDVSYTSVVYWGPETARQSGHKRFLWSHILGWDATEKLSFASCIDYGNENRVPGLQGLAFENAHWWGIAGYTRYKFTDKAAAAYRMEFFRDDTTYRTGLSTAVPAKSLWEQTITLEYTLYENLITRLEYRLDRSNESDSFNGDSFQSTIGAQMIYAFA